MPTNAEIEAAAKAIYVRRRAGDTDGWINLPGYIQDDYFKDATAALTAAEQVRASEWNEAIEKAAQQAASIPAYVDVDDNPDEQREATSVRSDIVQSIRSLKRAND